MRSTMQYADLKNNFKSRLRADSASLSVNDVDDNNILRWAYNYLDQVVEATFDPAIHSSLIVADFNMGVASSSDGETIFELPTDVFSIASVRAGTSSSSLANVAIMSLDHYNMHDQTKPFTTPVLDFPVGTVAGEKIHVKPEAVKVGRLSYRKQHPYPASDASDLLLTQEAGVMLIDFMLFEYYTFIEDNARAQIHLGKAMGGRKE